MKTIEVVAGVIYKDGKFLIAKRSYGEFKNMWEFPGGKIEENETHHEALIREIKEELELEIKVNEFITTINYQYSSFKLIMHVYKCDCLSGKINFNVHSKVKWITVKDLKNIKWVPADIKILDKLN